MKTISINHNEVEGERVHLHLEHNKSGYTWHTDDGEDVGQPASKTIFPGYKNNTMNNKERMNAACRAIGSYMATKWITDLDANKQEVLTDLLTDLRHYAGQVGIDWDKTDGMAKKHYEAEAKEERRLQCTGRGCAGH